jgi:DNA end-binding protein Ku
MAPRSFWKGYLKLSLVTCPVAMIPARSEAEKIRFHTLNRKTGNRVESRAIDAVTGKPVAEDDEAKAYQKGEDDYVILEDEELEAVALESTRTIDIETFIPAESIGSIWYDQPHFLVPDDKVGAEAFAVIREAMKATKMVGISRLVLYRRERAVMLEPRDAGIVLWTLRYGDEVRDPKTYFADIGDQKVDPKLLTLVTKLIDDRTQKWDAKMVRDPVQERLKEIIASKKKPSRPAKAKPEAARPSNVINIMDALRKSVAADAKPRGRR